MPHRYENNCDKICNECGESRSTKPHQYDHSCDAECNECGALRAADEHQFGEYFTVFEPTLTEDGIRSRECEICGFRESESISFAEENTFVIVLIIGGGVLALGIVIAVILLVRRFALTRHRRR